MNGPDMPAAPVPLEQVAPARPTLQDARVFGGVLLLGVVAALLPPYDGSAFAPLEAVLAVVLLGAVAALQLVVLRAPVRRWFDPVPAWACFAVLVLLRDATGGGLSGLVPLAAVPILWLALFGSRLDLQVGAGLTFLAFVAPILVVGAPTYPAHDWRRALLWSAVALFVAPVVQRVVRALAASRAQEKASSAQIRGVMRGATLSSLISTDTQGLITGFSVGAERLLGYRAADVVGQHSLAIFHVEDEVAEVAEELGVEPGFGVFTELAGRDSPSRVWTYRRADGDLVSVRLAVTELRDEHGVVVGYLGVAIDATAAVEALKEVRAAEERWRILLDHLPDTTVLVLDEHATIETCTGAGAMAQGLKDAVGKRIEEVSKPENAVLLKQLAHDATVELRDGTAEMTSTATGHVHEVVVAPLPETRNGRRLALVLGRDVSRDRARERALVVARDRAERLFDGAPQGILVLDADGRVVRANPAAAPLLDVPATTLVGLHLTDLQGTDDTALADHLDVARSSRSGRADATWTLHVASGSQVHLALSTTRIEDHDEGTHTFLVNLVDETQRHRFEQQLAHQADHDPLTGLANRRRFNDELDRHLEHCRRYGARGALLMMDLDHFKDVNDTLGHSTGDELIITIASLVVNSTRTTDLVARLGGDEFAVLLPEADRAGAEQVAETLVALIRDHVKTLDGTQRAVTASIGIVMVHDATTTAGDLLAEADMTMYDAKDAGRNCWVTLDHLTHARPRSGARLAWHQRIDDALDHGDLELHLQPIWDVRQGRVTGAEALLRLRDDQGLVFPDRFLYVAERTEQIHRIDAWVLGQACAVLARIQEVDPGFHLEVNISGRSISSPLVEAALVAGITEHAVDPEGLVLEITETAAVADVQSAQAFARRLMDLGCRFALDDFGAGFGSFYYLKHLLFDYIKIDGEFVAHCHVSTTDRSIVSSIVHTAHRLGKRTIAEFVSEQAILDVVAEEGVDFAQGYFIGRPVLEEEFAALHLRAVDQRRA